MNTMPKALFLSHGGGPMPLLGDPGHREMVNLLKQISANMPPPDAIVMISAHWEESIVNITSSPAPALIYDYYGFPQEAYKIEYACAGEPSLANEIHHLLKNANIDSTLNESRGFDHGMFVPLKIMYPEAHIPCVQLSLVDSLDPLQHIEIGQALHSLSQQNVLIIGSGFTFHNLPTFFAAETPQTQALNHGFEHWLLDTCGSTDYSETQRKQRLIQWTEAKGARFCHPREEHLLPLHVCYGLARTECSQSFELDIVNKKSSMYLW